MIKTILGFDVSSSTIGYAALLFNEDTEEITFKSANYLKPSHDGTILERLADTRDKIKKIIEDIKPDEIAIEDILLFVQNRSTAQTIVVLASFNRMIGLLSLDYLRKPPAMYSVLGIRHGIKIGKDFPAKEDIPELVAKQLKINFPYELSSRKSKGKKKPKIPVQNYDMADSCAVALMHAFVLAKKVDIKAPLPKKKKNKKEKKVKKNGRKRSL